MASLVFKKLKPFTSGKQGLKKGISKRHKFEFETPLN
jgi:hypothetical protein